MKKLVQVMIKIKSLLVVPVLDTPMNTEAADDYRNGTWEAKAREYTLKYAK